MGGNQDKSFSNRITRFDCLPLIAIDFILEKLTERIQTAKANPKKGEHQWLIDTKNNLLKSSVLCCYPVFFSGCDIAREILTQEDDEPLVPDTAANVNGAQFREATAPKD